MFGPAKSCFVVSRLAHPHTHKPGQTSSHTSLDVRLLIPPSLLPLPPRKIRLKFSSEHTKASRSRQQASQQATMAGTNTFAATCLLLLGLLLLSNPTEAQVAQTRSQGPQDLVHVIAAFAAGGAAAVGGGGGGGAPAMPVVAPVPPIPLAPLAPAGPVQLQPLPPLVPGAPVVLGALPPPVHAAPVVHPPPAAPLPHLVPVAPVAPVAPLLPLPHLPPVVVPGPPAPFVINMLLQAGQWFLAHLHYVQRARGRGSWDCGVLLRRAGNQGT